jgi:hypothetical protein
MERESRGWKHGDPTESYSLSVRVIVPGGLWLVKGFAVEKEHAHQIHTIEVGENDGLVVQINRIRRRHLGGPWRSWRGCLALGLSWTTYTPHLEV